MGKVAVFIDGGYIAKLCRHEFSAAGRPLRIDLGKLGQLLASRADSQLLRTYYYDAPPFLSAQPDEGERERQVRFDRFRYSLSQIERFEVRLGQCRRYYGSDGSPCFEQKGVDVLLAIDALKLALKGKIHQVILVTGDSDFVPVVKAIKEEGVEVQLYYHESSVHRHILEVCDERKLIDDALMRSCSLD